MTRTVWIDGTRHVLAPTALVGEGGEAEVYALGDGRVVKCWKPADHPDFAGLPDAAAAAARRLVEAPRKLRALPGGLPRAVVAPSGLAFGDARATEVVGYAMPQVAGEPLCSYGEPRWRREHAIDPADIVAVLVALHDAIAALHRAGIVIGDCNDLNVLVDGRAVHLIDVDSYQFGGFPCAMFSERFVDPRLCDAAAGVLAPVRPHDRDSDWFAFAAIALRTLLGVGAWGGVHAPAGVADRCPPSLRALRRRSVLGADITYPRAARPIATLPDELVGAFRDIFERDQRGEFPRALLAGLRLRACASCGEAHARVRCPSCQTAVVRPATIAIGNLRHHAIAVGDVGHAACEITSASSHGLGVGPAVWLDGGALWRAGALGPQRIGNVFAGQTRAWLGTRLGIGFYRAGGFAAAFVFRPDRGQLDDRVVLPRLRGQLVDAHATLADDRAYLWLTCAEHGRLTTTALVIGVDARTLAISNVTDQPWRAGIAGACAIGAHLFVPTDDGIARVELVGGDLVHTRTFAETAPLVCAGDRLAPSPSGLDVLRARDAIRLQLS